MVGLTSDFGSSANWAATFGLEAFINDTLKLILITHAAPFSTTKTDYFKDIGRIGASRRTENVLEYSLHEIKSCWGATAVHSESLLAKRVD